MLIHDWILHFYALLKELTISGHWFQRDLAILNIFISDQFGGMVLKHYK